MGIKDIFRKRATTPARGRAVPDPVPVDLGDRQKQGEYFVNYVDWDALNPAPPSWKIPELSEQMLWVAATIARHAEKGSLDEGVPDLMDREIHERMAEIAKEVDSAHKVAVRVEHDLFKQATDVHTKLQVRVHKLRQDRSRAEQGYLDAHEQLTGWRPDWSVTPHAVEPIVAPTTTQDLASITGGNGGAVAEFDGDGPSPLHPGDSSPGGRTEPTHPDADAA